MKRFMNAIGMVLLVVYILLPLLAIADALTVYEVTWQAPIAVQIGLALLAGILFVWTLWNKEKETISGWLAATLLPLSIVNALFSLRIGGEYIPALCGGVCFLAVVLYRSQAHKIVKGTAAILSFIGLIVFFVMAIIVAVFGSLVAPPEVIKEVPSPDGEHVARLIKNDIGFGGGCTVRVGDPLNINLLLCRITKTGEIVYQKEYYTDPTIAWDDNSTVRIDGEAHTVA